MRHCSPATPAVAASQVAARSALRPGGFQSAGEPKRRSRRQRWQQRHSIQLDSAAGLALDAPAESTASAPGCAWPRRRQQVLFRTKAKGRDAGPAVLAGRRGRPGSAALHSGCSVSTSCRWWPRAALDRGDVGIGHADLSASEPSTIAPLQDAASVPRAEPSWSACSCSSTFKRERVSGLLPQRPDPAAGRRAPAAR